MTGLEALIRLSQDVLWLHALPGGGQALHHRAHENLRDVSSLRSF